MSQPKGIQFTIRYVKQTANVLKLYLKMTKTINLLSK